MGDYVKLSKQSEDAQLTMELRSEMERMVTQHFDLEIEILRGTREKMADGRARIEITIADPDKIDLMRRFVLALIANQEQKICSQ